METQNSGIKFKRSALAKYDAITAPGKYKAVVSNNVSEKNLFSDDNGSRYIVGLRSIFPDKLAQVKELFKDQEEVAIEETNGLFATGSIWKNEGQSVSLPMRGEEVEVTVGYVPSQDGEEVLRVTNISVLPAKVAAKVSLVDLLQEVSAEITH